MGIRGELYTTQVTLDNRSYFFNVKENRTGDIFLQVVESKNSKEGGDFDRHQIAIFQEDLQKFLQGLDDSLQYIDKEQRDRAKARAEKKAAKEAKYGKGGYMGDPEVAAAAERRGNRRKGESRLVAEKREARRDDGIKRTGRIHVVSKRSVAPTTSEDTTPVENQ